MNKTLKNFLAPTILFIFVTILIELIVIGFKVSPFILPRPTVVLESFMENFNALAVAGWNSFIISICGFLLSLVVGIFIALIMAQSRLIERSLYPYALFLQCVPIVALAPVFIKWFGSGMPSMIVISFVISLFPIITATVNGLTSVKKEYLEMMKLYGADWKQILFKIRFPSAVPYMITGARVSAGLSVVGAIIGEFFTGKSDAKGIAYLIRLNDEHMDTPYFFATTLAAAILGLVIFSLTGIISKIIIKTGHFEERK